ncbi:hypothetical protein BKA65DRAFT_573223 [Rhexocercosporidium sp. MPI-PUGE-AT-0058]|nr:hypothetical protein BKA65DRAFT_573223 [Rhexocercosporidium sp. MPI-PUGE-AT-0058]
MATLASSQVQPAPKKRRLLSTKRPFRPFGPRSSDSEEGDVPKPPKAALKPEAEEPKWENAGTEIVKLIVGKEGKEFSIHKHFICKASEAMKAAFCGEFEEGRTGVMMLVEDDPAIVQDFVAYCDPNFAPATLQGRKVDVLVGLYIFADQYRCANSLKNIVMDDLQNKMAAQLNLHLSQETMKRIFDNTPSAGEAPIRKYCAALMTYTLFTSETVTTESLQEILVNIPELQLACLNYQRVVSHCKCYGTPMNVAADPRKRCGIRRICFGECYFHVHTGERPCDYEWRHMHSCNSPCLKHD